MSDEPRLVECVKLKESLPAMRRQPFPNEFGEYLFANVSQKAWEAWLQESVRYINTYSVDLSSRQGTEFMLKQMKIYFGVEDGELAQTAWTAPKEGEETGSDTTGEASESTDT